MHLQIFGLCQIFDLYRDHIQIKKISDARKLDTEGFIVVCLFRIPLKGTEAYRC